MDTDTTRPTAYPSPAAAPTPTLHKLPESNPPQRRNSYRRPPDVLPYQLPPPEPAMSDAVPSNTARPVSNGASRSSSHRRRHSQHISPPTTDPISESIPAAPDVPSAPPVSYRDPYAVKPSSRGCPRSRDPAIQTNPSRREQPSVQTAAGRLLDLRSPPYAPMEPLSGTVDRRSSQRKPSVPDRSPLQKLEGKLDDISKEARRVRMLEAELAAQEKIEADHRAKRAREAAQIQQRAAAQLKASPMKAANAPRQKSSPKRHVSMPVQSPKSPDISDLDSEDGYAYDLSEPWDPSAGTAVAVPVYQPAQRQQRVVSAPLRGPPAEVAVARSLNGKGKEPTDDSRGTGSYRDRVAVPTEQAVHRKPLASPGLGLTGFEDTSAGAQMNRRDSQRVTTDAPAVQEPTRQRSRRDSRGIIAAQMEMQQQALDQNALTPSITSHRPPSYGQPTPNAPRKSVGFSEPENDLQPHTLNDPEDHVSQLDQGPERSYVKPPELEEWRGAPIATLVAEDLDLDMPARQNSTNKAWWEERQANRNRRPSSYTEPTYDGYVDVPTVQTSFNPPLYLKCGPLLRYTGLRKDKTRTGRDREVWRGSVMIVTTDAQSSYQKPPTLRMFNQPMDLLPPPPPEANRDTPDPTYAEPIEGQFKVSRTGETLYVKAADDIAEDEDLSRIEDDTGLFTRQRSMLHSSRTGIKSSRIHKRDGEKLGKMREITGVRLHAERGVTFWRFNLEVELGSRQARVAYRINQGPAVGFWVPARGETMNIMFHSCNGFSLSVDTTKFCGPDPMWRDVLNKHQIKPFHVMLGGGDQIYNDAATRQTTLFRQWTEHKNPLQKHHTPFSEAMQDELEQFYLNRYCMWFSQGLFGMANSQIPMVNIWDDHDIIDGYGSYPHHFMQTPVFTGVGAVAFKYYMLFQHQSVTTETEKTEPSWVIGKSPGPYIKEQSRSVFLHLGREIAFLGLDCRTERRRDEILTEDTYDVVFDRLEDEIIPGETKHLIVLLGVPIAYPRLNFLEKVLTSRVMDPIKALGRAGVLGNFVNKFDGGVEILDDLDDHWTAKHHKDERNWLVGELQHIAKTKSVRVTILGGDVHLAAVSRFYSNKKLKIPKDKDARYMLNVISSAIVNTPPPDVLADVLNKRNKVHHLDEHTDEDMVPIFTHDVDWKKRNNNHLLPRRNWCSIREYDPESSPPHTPQPPAGGEVAPGITRSLSGFNPRQMMRRFSTDQGQERPTRGRGPPVSYYNNPANTTADELRTGVRSQPQSSFSPDRSEPERPRSRRASLTSLFRRRASSVDSVARADSSQAPPQQNRDHASQDRPSNFHRRPSVLKRKRLEEKGDYVNLEGGLDICLNVEVSQHNPDGATEPYRLFVPALDYKAPEPGTVEAEGRKSVFGGIFDRRRRRRAIGDDGYSQSGSESESDLGELSDEEERARQRYRVGPRIVLPSFGSRNKRNAAAERARSDPDGRLSSGFHTNNVVHVSQAQNDGSRDIPSQSRDRRQSMDAGPIQPASQDFAGESVAARRRTSAPYSPATPQTATSPPSRSTSARRQPSHNSSHRSQLPASESPEHRAMGGILNQTGSDRLEHGAHVLAHTPSQSKRTSYPPHPAIVGGGPGSPYRDNGMQARDATGGDYFNSGGRDGKTHSYASSGGGVVGRTQSYASTGGVLGVAPERTVYPERSGFDRTSYPAYPAYPQAGVGARYLGGGRYEEDEDSLSDDEDDVRRYVPRREAERSEESFVPPKPKKKWQIWR